MADSSITKKALAASLKNLMHEKAFSKISVGEICEGCEMNRKSFYYHFCDKYELVNWIFDTEYIAFAKDSKNKATWEIFDNLCGYLYENNAFYRRALKIEGQNSFPEHFRIATTPIFKDSLKAIMGNDTSEFHINFFCDAIICAITRWVLDKNGANPKEFSESLRSCITVLAEKNR